MNVENRTLFIADNLDIMRGIDSETVDLIYLDPPFNTNRNYKAPIGSPAEGAQFKDIWKDEDIKQEWHGQIAAEHEQLYQIIKASETTYDRTMKIYLTAMAVRLFEMHRVLKPAGSIYLHCDPTASHYLKVIMDDLFGHENFRNEIVWRIGWISGFKSQKKGWIRNHDTILYYTKNRHATKSFNKEYIPYPEDYVRRDGKKPTGRGIPIEDTWNCSETDILNSIMIMSFTKEKTGYPTQKPLKLLERIIKASSNEGDMVLDPFCGCATACVAAEKLQRQWIGIDISPSAEVITKIRLEEASQQGALFSPIQMSDVTVTSTLPERTDNAEEIAIQQRLPMYQTHKPELFGKQEGRCNGCGYEFHYRNLSIDHIKPRSKGIDNRIENLQLLCTSCNSKKGTGTQEELIQKLKYEKIISAD